LNCKVTCESHAARHRRHKSKLTPNPPTTCSQANRKSLKQGNPPIFILLSLSLLSAPLLSFSGSSPCIVISQVPGTIFTWTRTLLNRLRLRSVSSPVLGTGFLCRVTLLFSWIFLGVWPITTSWFGSVPHRPTSRNISAAPNTHVHLYVSVILWDQLGKNTSADVPRYPTSTSAINLHT